MITQLGLKSPAVMGILNVTPDSFSDGGRFFIIDEAIQQALSMIGEGASIIDVGGESSRPYAEFVSEAEELARVIPVIKALRERSDVPISIDTYKPAVMRAALEAGASMINDIKALQSPGAIEVARQFDVPICLMHMQGDPQTMQDAPKYQNGILDEISHFFQSRIDACAQAGIDKSRLILDPGFGFGKTLKHNLQLLNGLSYFSRFSCPLLVGVSRKSAIGEILQLPTERRLVGSLVMAGFAVNNGASIIRAHDVKETVEAVTIAAAISHEAPYVGNEA